MENRIFSEREQAMEANYFRQQDAKLLEKLRQRAPLDEIAGALRDKLQIDNPELLQRVRDVGITPDTAAAFFIAPLVQVAWAEGKVSKLEREAVIRLAHARGVADGSPAEAQLLDWLKVRPSDALFQAAVDILKYSFAVLPAEERDERIRAVVHACHEVAAASGGELARLLGLGDGVSSTEASILDTITKTLRSHG